MASSMMRQQGADRDNDNQPQRCSDSCLQAGIVGISQRLKYRVKRRRRYDPAANAE
jgi:hypothetical protein